MLPSSEGKQIEENGEFLEAWFSGKLLCITKGNDLETSPGWIRAWRSCCCFVLRGIQAEGKATIEGGRSPASCAVIQLDP